MDIASPVEFNTVLEMSGEYSLKIAFWEGADQPLAGLAGTAKKNGGENKVMVLIGPEGGFSAEEIRKAEAAGFVSYALGPRILRAETAAVTAAGLVQYLLGDLGEASPCGP
tara:strand:- start:116 stop:448 length:333 start_codon:yes stop_codon:yes gene_type:complete